MARISPTDSNLARCSNAKGAHDLSSELARSTSHLISVSTESTLPSSSNEILSIGIGAAADDSGGISLSAAAAYSLSTSVKSGVGMARSINLWAASDGVNIASRNSVMCSFERRSRATSGSVLAVGRP